MAVALIVAGGRGARLRSGTPKALVSLAGRPMLDWSIATLRSLEMVEEIVVALPADFLRSAAPTLPGVICVAGGAYRSQSVLAALAAAGTHGPVIVHDAARPFAPAKLFVRALEALERDGADAVVAAAPLSDTVKQIDADGKTIVRTLDRSRLWAAQTPQVFRHAVLKRVLTEASQELLQSATDDAWLVERMGGTVHVVPSEEFNLKVTTANDLHLAELLLAERAASV